MLTLLTAAWLAAMPIAPLNPIEEDTLPAVNLHFTLGVTTPNHVVHMGPELSAKWEILATHPLVIRAAFDYQYNSVKLKEFPDSHLHQGTLSLCALYYRGTNRLTGYIGAGPILRFGHFSFADAVTDSLATNHAIVNVDLKTAAGYRIVLGLRYHQVYSLEVGVTEIRSHIQYSRRINDVSYSTFGKPSKLTAFRVTVGYLFTLKDIW